MESLSKIPSEGTWPEIANKANENFTKISLEMEKLGIPSSFKMPLFSSLAAAKSSIPRPYVGQLILVGSTLPAPVYRWNGTAWENTGITSGNATAPLTDYATKEQMNSELNLRDDEIGRIRTEMGMKVTVEAGKGLSSNDFTTEEKQKLQGLNNYDDTAITQQQSELKKQVDANRNDAETKFAELQNQHQVLSEAEYEALVTKSPDTIYLTFEE